MADYADATADFALASSALRQAEQPSSVYLPAVQLPPAPMVYQPTPLPDPAPLIAPRDVRLVATGLCGLCSGGGVFLVCAGIHLAGPYLWPATGLVSAVAMLTALLKGKTSTGGGTTVNIRGNKNRIGSIR